MLLWNYQMKKSNYNCTFTRDFITVKTCICPDGFAQNSVKICTKCNCGKNFGCTFSFTDRKKCNCTDGYTENSGICKADCKVNPCKNGGKCMIKDKDLTCKCLKPFYGEFCEKVDCSRNPCKNGGKCIVKDNDIICNCSKSYIGDFCETSNPCYPKNPCLNGGNCSVSGIVAVCHCPAIFTGKTCDKISAEKCSKYKPNCKKTRGHCISDENKAILCLCPKLMKYKDNFGCQIHEDLCNERFANCIKTGGSCLFDDAENIECKCPSDMFYVENHGCKKSCDSFDSACQNGGKCIEREKQQFCECKNGTSGHSCENIDGCKTLRCEQSISVCSYDQILEEAFCKCKQINRVYSPVTRGCREIDGCILKMIDNECFKEHEQCINGECKCEENYRYSEDNETCEENKCASCPTNSVCDPESDDPCKCKDGFYFYESKCIKYGKCDVGFSQCSQKCDISSGDCKCEAGFTLSNDNQTCEILDDNFSCDLNCSPGSCIENGGRKICICPQATHAFVNDSCIDVCTASKGKPPKGLKCPGLCESDNEEGIRCKCEDPYKQADDGIHCERKEMCKEPDVKEECIKRSALCREVSTGKGYEYYCDTPFTLFNNTVCKRKCDFIEKECSQLNAVCALNDDYEAECRCLPLLTRKYIERPCNEIAEASYFGELTFLKWKYVVKDKIHNTKSLIDLVMLENELQRAAVYVYGWNTESVNVMHCIIESEVLRCEIEFQFYLAPTDINLIMSPLYCNTLKEGFCIIKDLVIKRNKSANVFRPTDPCKLKDIFCDLSTDCSSDVKHENFRCTCKPGFKPTGSFYLPGKSGSVVQRCVDIDECTQNVHNCPENTTCINTYGSYKCECALGFKRKFPNKDPKEHRCEAVCDPNPCKNAGECVQKRDNGFICKCEPLYTGLICNETVPEKSCKTNSKLVIILGSTIGISFILILVLIVVLYKRLKEVKHVNYQCSKRIAVETIRIQTNENRPTEMRMHPTDNKHELTKRQLPSDRITRRSHSTSDDYL